MLRDILPSFSVVLSPMEAVTNPPFRKICKRYGADVLISEFISSEALVRKIDSSCRKMCFGEEEHPIGIQIFGNTESSLREAAEYAAGTGCDFIDINWGCPVRKIAGKGCGSGILNDIPKMVALTKSVVDTVSLPVTVKTRLGYSDEDKPIVDVAERLQDVGIEAISIHGRTRSQMYKGKADWTLIKEVKDNPRMKIMVLGNGDIDSAEKLVEYKKRYNVDGILIGRAAMGNPFIFRQCKQLLRGEEKTDATIRERVAVCREHIAGLKSYRGDRYALLEMRKFYGGYFFGLGNFKPYRIRLVTADSYEQVEEILSDIEEHYFED